jgi:hypothetical protein
MNTPLPGYSSSFSVWGDDDGIMSVSDGFFTFASFFSSVRARARVSPVQGLGFRVRKYDS